MLRIISFLLISFILSATSVFADDEHISFGGDEYIFTNKAIFSNPVRGDIFAFGADVSVLQSVGGDAHIFSNYTNISGDVGGNTYIMSNDVTVSGKTEHDLMAAGSKINITGAVNGNVRAAGANIILNAPVAGSVSVAAGRLSLGSTISGDFSFSGGDLEFGTGALILGKVTVRTSKDDFKVPISVAAAERVTIEKISEEELGFNADNIAHYAARGFWVSWVSYSIGLIILSIIGIAWLALFPKQSMVAYKAAMGKPFKSLIFGLGSTAALIGFIPICIMLLISIPLVPFAIIVVFIAILIGYMAGAWFLATQILAKFNLGNETLGERSIAMVVGLVAASLLSLIPIIGWIVRLGILFFGIGGIIFAWIGRSIDKDFHANLANDDT